MGSFFNSIKRCGVDVSEILMGLVLMPFYQVSSVASLVKNGFDDSLSGCGKDVYYDLKNNEKINWRSLLWLVALRFKKISSSLNSYVEKVKLRAFIADDSLLAKTGEKTEFISHVHDHVSGNFMLGYKLLVLGYWDSDSFYLVQYTILFFHKRICCSNTFDGIFESVMADIAEYNLAEKLQKIFWLIVETMSEFTGIDVMELTEDIFRDTNASEKLKKLNIFLPKEQLFDRAA
ncbi:hypothetical protein ES705_50019 [subsurface metagenome]